MRSIVDLVPGDEERVDGFLRTRADTSMFLRSNLRQAGLVFDGQPRQADWVGLEASGCLVGVAAHGWNGIVLLEAPGGEVDVARAAVARSSRPVTGLIGPWEQVVAARHGLGLDGRGARLESREDLFSLDLARLRVPRRLEVGAIQVRRAEPDDQELLAAWRHDYDVEALAADPSPETAEKARRDIRRATEERSLWIAEADGTPVSMSGFNARLPDCVQVGGVYTPPDLRGNSGARSCVAGSLIDARAEGALRSVLFTEHENEPARRAYLALGYEVVGDYGIVLFGENP